MGTRDLPNPGIEPESLAPPALAGGFFTPEPPEYNLGVAAAASAKSLQLCPTLCLVELCVDPAGFSG